jgi:hypothetical protein
MNSGRSSGDSSVGEVQVQIDIHCTHCGGQLFQEGCLACAKASQEDYQFVAVISDKAKSFQETFVHVTFLFDCCFTLKSSSQYLCGTSLD